MEIEMISTQETQTGLTQPANSQKKQIQQHNREAEAMIREAANTMTEQ